MFHPRLASRALLPEPQRQSRRVFGHDRESRAILFLPFFYFFETRTFEDGTSGEMERPAFLPILCQRTCFLDVACAVAATSLAVAANVLAAASSRASAIVDTCYDFNAFRFAGLFDYACSSGSGCARYDSIVVARFVAIVDANSAGSSVVAAINPVASAAPAVAVAVAAAASGTLVPAPVQRQPRGGTSEWPAWRQRQRQRPF